MSEEKSSAVYIGLVNPKSPTNVGAVLRAAGCYRVDAVRYTGQRYARAAQYQTDTKNRAETIPLNRVEVLSDDLPADMQVVCVELIEGATPLPEFVHPPKALYIFGPEDGSTDQQVVDRADSVVYIPTEGCMNLAATVNVVLYDRLAKGDLSFANDALISHSKDRNSRAKIR
ncbi:tRNA(Leu) C34 or U34 (ribose-2'-O)-methylase TrmL [Sinobacterium caligoides]|uniref:tRNA(Leu) C34 or U34 (Ribose-2'-O)-methylase TrmL n=1 Tax=Sinobacterium caligoides TaxID=933926 RepID=A0A3N2DQ56_9GAMM|nr:RNA methyltransferase [Sinobacterium caligoides]ROS01749.1 tRNA(Leu) C34 or U34 (ribose-2'-O)-methylase TrmL [Sinobacterium caligoides]